jgi:hypothetical protein
MAGGCADCFPGAKELQLQISTIQNEAKQYAIANKKLVVIYQKDDGNLAFMDADQAKASGIVPRQLVSHLQPVAT